jgi:NTE family protein
MDQNQNTEKISQDRKKVGIVVGSGGIKSMAAIGLIEFLEENNVDVDLLVGCSGGGIIAALQGIGYRGEEIFEICLTNLNKKEIFKLDYRSILGIANLPFTAFNKSSGILKNIPILDVYKRMYGDRKLEDLKTKLILQATDFLNGDRVVLENGPLAESVYASGALYPILPPINISGRWLIDGGFSSPLPILEAVNRGCHIIIAMYFHALHNPDPKGLIPCYLNVLKTCTHNLTTLQNLISIDLHHHEIVILDVKFNKSVLIWETEKFYDIIEAGRQEVKKRKHDILSALKT